MENQITLVGMMNAMVPITRFNRGEASKIFDEVEVSGSKIVVKNNRPACVLIAPEKYEALMEMLSDYQLLLEAQERMARDEKPDRKTHEEMLSELGVTQAELNAVDVDIE